MIRTEIDLTVQENDFLNAIAIQTGKTQNEIIRKAIERLIGEFDRELRLNKMRAARGMWKDRNDLPDFEEMRRSLQRFPSGSGESDAA
jgi:hypothetical protein